MQPKPHFNFLARLYIVLLFLGFITSIYAKDILLLKTYDEKAFSDQNISEFLMSEKLDGVRGIWDGKVMRTRSQKDLVLPKFFTKSFPPFELDGELWIKKESFDEISSLVHKKDSDENSWKKVSYNVFDVPNACEEFGLKECSLSNRLAVLEKYLEKNPSNFIKIIPQFPIKSQKHLQEFYKTLIQNKAEGVVIRKNLAPYERKRSSNAFKLKPFKDAECKVIQHIKGKGKYANALGSLLCEANINNKKIVFKIGAGFSDYERMNPPPIGGIITYKYHSLTKNSKPRFASFLRIYKQ